MEITAELRALLLTAQRNEITGHHVYRALAARLTSPRDEENQRVLEKIAADELGHYRKFKNITGQEVAPNRLAVSWYSLLNRLFGFTFAVKLMEKGEDQAQEFYNQIAPHVPNIEKIIADEDEHEGKLLLMLDEERLRYASSVVLGLNDALVELTGALAGLTLALQNVQLIALTGTITGVAASFSMAASEYLSTRAEETNKRPIRAAVYTGIAYIFTVASLILPYLLIKNQYICLAIALVTAVVIIALFNYYISVAKGENFRRRFLEMAGVSLGVALLSFIFSFFIRQWLGVEVE